MNKPEATEHGPGMPHNGSSGVPSTSKQRIQADTERHVSFRFRLAMLVVACVLPVWLAAGFLIYYSYQSKRALTERHMLDTGRALTLLVDRELAKMQAGLTVLGSSPSLDSGNLAAFHSQAQTVINEYPGADIILADATGQQIVNSFQPFGTPLPKRNVPDAVRRIYQTGKPSITNLFRGAVTGRPLIGVDVPVLRKGRVIYDLSMTVPADQLASVLAQQHLSPEWIGTILDCNYAVVARTRYSELFVGHQAGPRVQQRTTESAEGLLEVANLEGTLMIDSFNRSATSGWTVVVGVPRVTFMAPIWRWLWWTIAGTGLLSIIGVGLAMLIGRTATRIEEGSRRLSDIVESSADAIIGKSLDGIIQTWNRGAEQLYGYSAEEMVGRHLSALLPDEDVADLSELSELVRTGKAVERYGITRRHKSGALLSVALKVSPVFDRFGKIVGASAIARDITQLRRAQEALWHASEQRLLALEAAELGAWEYYVESGDMFRDEVCLKMYGIPAGRQISYAEGLAHIHPEDQAAVDVAIKQALAGLNEGVYHREFRVLWPDGSVHWVASYGRVHFEGESDHRRPARFIGVNMEISERKRKEEQLQKLNRTLKALNNSNQALLNATDEPSLLQNVCRIVTKDCAYAMAWIGFAEDDEAKSVRPVAHAGFDEGYLETVRVTWADNEKGRGPTGTAIRTGQPCACRNMLTDPRFEPWRGEALKRGYAASLVLPLMADGKAFGAITIYSKEPDPFTEDEVKLLSELANDLAYGIGALRLRAAHARADKALRESEERWAVTLQSIGDAVISTDAAGRVVFMNSTAEKLTGWSLQDAKGNNLDSVFDIVNEATREKPESPVSKVIRLNKVVALENHTILIRRDGQEISIDDSAAPILDRKGAIDGVVLVFRDVTDKKRAQAVLRSSERLATTGRMAASIAHEIHNPLDTVANLLYMIEHGKDPDDIRAHAALASQELGRVVQMTKNMLAFNREATKPAPVKIAEVLESVAALFQRRMANLGITLESKFEFDGTISAYPHEMRQIFANLLGNAIEAVGENPRIRLHARAGKDWKDGRLGVRVSVADNGAGIRESIRGRIFDPFFTTKGEAGTGLGLWITHGIIERHEGTIRIYSSTQPGRSGTCFSIFLPFELRPVASSPQGVATWA